ncbi:MAG: PilN domain-containing protein [Planctomycetota bacterium]
MKSRDILGIDVSAGRLRVVQLRATAGGAAKLVHAAGRDVPPRADGATLGATLRRMLDEEGLTARTAVIGVPAGRGFVQCVGGQKGKSPERFPPAEYISDGWRLPSDRQVRAVASRSDVQRLREAAAAASIELGAVNLQAMGCLLALWPADEPVRGGQAGLVIGAHAVTLVLRDGPAVLASHTRERSDAPGADEARMVEQMYRLARTAHPEVTLERVRLIVNKADEQTADDLPDRLGVPVEVVHPGGEDRLRLDDAPLPNRADFAAAIGLAMQGLEMGRLGDRKLDARSVNLLRLPPEGGRRRRFRWRTLATAAAGAFVLLAALLGVEAYRRHRTLSDLQAQWQKLEPRVQKDRQVLQRWQHMQDWVRVDRGGYRMPNREILGEVARLLPEQLYIRQVKLTDQSGQQGRRLRLEGRAKVADPVYELVTRLNQSRLFEGGQPGPLTDAQHGGEFSRNWSAVVYVRR